MKSMGVAHASTHKRFHQIAPAAPKSNSSGRQEADGHVSFASSSRQIGNNSYTTPGTHGLSGHIES